MTTATVKLSRIIMADDHPIFRKGLKEILQETFPKVQIIECQNGEEVIENISNIEPEVVILDINMPKKNGLEVCRYIAKEHIDTKVIMLTMYHEKEMVRTAMLAGASGYLLKENAVEEIISCINKVMLNEKFIDMSLMPNSADMNEMDKIQDIIKSLTPAELKTLKLVSKNLTSKEIGERLFLSEKTIENYRSRICQKLDLPPKNNSLIHWINKNKEYLFMLEDY